MQDAAPMPDEGEVRLQRLRALLAEMRAAAEEEERRLSGQLNDIVPNARELAMEAANNPSVTRRNAKEWFRAKLPSWINSETMGSTIILGLFSLYLIYSGMTFRDMTMGGLNRPPPMPPRLLPWMPIPTPMMATPDACNGGSVVDEVFAKHEARTRA